MMVSLWGRSAKARFSVGLSSARRMMYGSYGTGINAALHPGSTILTSLVRPDVDQRR